MDSEVERLQQLGLYVERNVPGAMTDRAPSDGLTIARALVPQDGLYHLEDACFVFPLNNCWTYRNWNGIGGRGPDDVHIENLSLEQAIQFVENFYFGNPIVIDDWSFPANQHPDWDVDRLHAAFRAAITVSNAEWRYLRAMRHAESKELPAADTFFRKFREVDSVKPVGGIRLWMRNDLAEMYFVRQP